MIIGDSAHPKTGRRELALTFLSIHGQDPMHRDYYVQLGYQYGLTKDEIDAAVNHG